MDLTDPKLTDLAFRVLPVVRELARARAGGNPVEADLVAAVSKRVSEIEAGISPESEFIAAVNWLGQTLTINRIEQTPLPPYHPNPEGLKVPDIICVVTIDGRTLPLLIEVKKSSDDKLVWSEKYLSGLRRYADALNVPLLVAWKSQHFWTLTDLSHFEKKVESYHLNFKRALCENLMGLLFGDARVQLTQRIAFYLDAEITDSSQPLPPPPTLIPQGIHTIKIQGAGFLLDEKPIELSNELTWLFFRASDENVVDRTGEKTIRMRFVPEAETMFSLSDFALMIMLSGQDDEPDWEHILRQEISISASNVQKELQKGLEAGVVKYVLNQVPQTVPKFLSR